MNAHTMIDSSSSSSASEVGWGGRKTMMHHRSVVIGLQSGVYVRKCYCVSSATLRDLTFTLKR